MFSYNNILLNLVKDNTISPQDEYALRELRQLKVLYREGLYHMMPDRKVLEGMQRIMSRCFHIDFDSKTIHSRKLSEKMLGESVNHPDKYCRLRLAEGAIRTRWPAQVIHQQHENRFQRLMVNQNLYGLFHGDLSSEVRREAIEIIGQQNG